MSTRRKPSTKSVATEAASTPASIRAAFLVLGAHRGGTHLFAGILQRLGAASPKTLSGLNAVGSNGDLTSFVRAHEQVLASAGSRWSDWAPFNPDWIDSPVADKFEDSLGSLFEAEFGDAPLVAMHDPRVCRFAGFWLNLLVKRDIRPLPVIVVRNPLEVATALSRSDGMPITIGLLLWLRHFIDAERSTRGLSRAFVNYHDVLADWRKVMAGVRDRLGVRWPRFSPATELEIDAWIDPSLSNEIISDSVALSRRDVAEWVRKIYAVLLQLAKEGETQAALKVFDLVAAEFDKSSAVFGVVTQRLEDAALASEAEAARLTIALSELGQRERMLDMKANALWRDVEAERLRGAELAADIGVLADRLKAAETFEARVTSLTNDISAMSDRAKAGEARAEALTSELGEVVARAKMVDARAAALAAALDLASERLRAAEQRAELLDAKSAANAAKADAAEGRVEALTRSLAEAAEAVRTISVDLKGLAAERDAQRRRADDLAAHKAIVETALAARDGEIADMSQQHAAALEALAESTGDSLMRASFEAELIRLDEAREHEAQVAGILKAQVIDLERALKAATSRIKALEASVETTNRRGGASGDDGSFIDLPGKSDLNRKAEITSTTIRVRMFDEAYYKQQARMRGLIVQGDPVEHFLAEGAKLGFNPHPEFDSNWYLDVNPDVALSGENPLVHYLRDGKAEGRSPNRKTDLKSSTYYASRPYDFVPVRELNATSGRYAEARSLAPARIAFYTAIMGGYDELCLHEHLMPSADYHVFSDDPVLERFVYHMRPVPYFDTDPTRAARFVKTHPHMLLPGYEVAVWIDGNILVRGDISREIEAFLASGLAVGAIPHPLRTTVYEEVDECQKRSKDDSSTMIEQVRRYREEGFDGAGLVESNFMMFRLGHPALAGFLDAWWAEIEKGSRRDQLSLAYALRQAGTTFFPLTKRPNSVRNHRSLALFHHGSLKRPTEVEPLIARTPSLAKESYAEVKEARLATQRSLEVDVIVCVHNGLDVVQLCLESVQRNRDPDRHRILIINDGSDPETTAWLEGFAAGHSNAELIRHDVAMGYTRAANVGLRAMQGDMAILLNSDTIVPADWIEKMADAVFSNTGAGIVGPMSSAASHQSLPDHKSTANQTAINDLPPGFSVDEMNRWCEQNSPADFVPRVPLVHGFCFGVTKATIDKVGYFDESHFPHGYGEENDYCFRAVNAGVSLVIATHTYVYHKKSQSYEGDRRTALMKAGNQKIRDLHGDTRVVRAVKAMQENPVLMRLRQMSRALFEP